MLETERGGFEQPRHPLNATEIFAGPNDGLSQTCNGVSTFVGLQGSSQRAGYRVIFPTLDMGRFVEIAEEDILATEDLAPAHSPFGALGGTRVSVREAARILTSRAGSQMLEADDEFDLDIRLGASGWSMPPFMHEGAGEAIYAPGMEGEERQAKPIETNGACPVTVACKTRVTCDTCADTCLTCKGEATCQTCQTCHTHCEQATCQTCKGEATCGGATCLTCADRGCPIHTQTCCKDTCI
jgi:hypothetical protein